MNAEERSKLLERWGVEYAPEKRPDDYFTAAEWAEKWDMPESSARNRLIRLVSKQGWLVHKNSRGNAYRPPLAG